MASRIPEVTVDEVRRLFHYDSSTGLLERRVSLSIQCPAGSIAGYVNGRGYTEVRIGRRCYRVHRLAFVCMTGRWPAGDVDHINGVKTDNRWENLRDVPHRTNVENQRLARKHNQTGFLGVSPCGNRFMATIRHAGRSKYLGLYGTPEEAHAVYIEAKRRLHAGCTL